MDRFILTDAQWAKMAPYCLRKPTDPGRSCSDNRLFIETVLWIVRSCSPGVISQSILETGALHPVASAIGVVEMYLQSFLKPARMSQTSNMQWTMRSSSMSTAMDRAQRGTRSRAIGRSKGGMTSKILALADAFGNLVRFELLPGHRFSKPLPLDRELSSISPQPSSIRDESPQTLILKHPGCVRRALTVRYFFFA
ncbi:hypothetical protein [Rhizobium sp. ZPR3]|uniref:Transposase n=2 Tax=unclassified Rhizobium TaxID=2613769 RepID=A0AAU7SAY7_9HYPH